MRGSRANCARYRAQMKRTEDPEPISDKPSPKPLRDLDAWLHCFNTAQGRRFSAVPAALESREYSAANLPTLYLETSVISYLTARETRDTHAARKQLITRHWWHKFSSHHTTFSSDVVHMEARRGDPHAAARRTEVLSRFPCIHQTSQSNELAARIFALCRLPARAEGDAHHVAIAAINGLHVVLTWNCSHLANGHMIPLMRHACEAYGYAVPHIYTPEQLIGVCAYG
jgi:hypothetical protein